MIRQLFFAIALIFNAFSFGKIVECEHFKEIYDHIDHETVIVLDIDDTLLVPSQMLGCDEWFMSRLAHHKASLPSKQALEAALAEWEGLRHLTHMILVEPNTSKIIADLQSQNYCVMGLTTQGLALATRTSLQLQEHGINLSLTAPTQEDHYFSINHHGVLFRNGILFTSGQSKAGSFEALCQASKLAPKKIVFINDKETHLKDLEEYALKHGAAFTGLRYGYSDFRKKAYSDVVANYQFQNSSFEHIMSDEDALSALEAE